MFLHMDIDSFFISAERSRNPSLRGVPAAVGGRSDLKIFEKRRRETRLMNLNEGSFVTPVFYDEQKRDFENTFVERSRGERKIRGIVTTASYEARAMGVKTGMPLAVALRLCPRLKVVPADMLFYHEISHSIDSFLQSIFPEVEQYSIDEFFIRLPDSDKESPTDVAETLQRDIQERFHIPVSIGISSAKWIAKLATSFAKPYGIYRVEDIGEFIENIPIEDFPGIGRGYRRRLKSRGIERLGEIAMHKRLFYSWGVYGMTLYHRIMGDDREGIERKGLRKSIGISRTFDPLANRDELSRRIMVMARHISYMVSRLGVNPTIYYLKIAYEYGVKRKESVRVDRLFSENLFKRYLRDIFFRIDQPTLRVVKISLGVSGFTSVNPRVLSLMEIERDMKMQKIDRYVHSLREKFGIDILKSASELL